MRGRNPWTRKLGALVMALALCVGLLPASALAAEPESWEHTEHDNSWTELTAEKLGALNYTLENGKYYLSSTERNMLPNQFLMYNMTKSITVTGNVTLCLNNVSYTYTGSEQPAIVVQENASLTICGCAKSGNNYLGNIFSNNVLYTVSNNGTLHITSGEISSSVEYGAPIYNAGICTISGGKVSGSAGGGWQQPYKTAYGVYNAENGNLTITGNPEISGQAPGELLEPTGPQIDVYTSDTIKVLDLSDDFEGIKIGFYGEDGNTVVSGVTGENTAKLFTVTDPANSELTYNETDNSLTFKKGEVIDYGSLYFAGEPVVTQTKYKIEIKEDATSSASLTAVAADSEDYDLLWNEETKKLTLNSATARASCEYESGSTDDTDALISLNCDEETTLTIEVIGKNHLTALNPFSGWNSGFEESRVIENPNGGIVFTGKGNLTVEVAADRYTIQDPDFNVKSMTAIYATGAVENQTNLAVTGSDEDEICQSMTGIACANFTNTGTFTAEISDADTACAVDASGAFANVANASFTATISATQEGSNGTGVACQTFENNGTMNIDINGESKAVGIDDNSNAGNWTNSGKITIDVGVSGAPAGVLGGGALSGIDWRSNAGFAFTNSGTLDVTAAKATASTQNKTQWPVWQLFDTIAVSLMPGGDSTVTNTGTMTLNAHNGYTAGLYVAGANGHDITLNNSGTMDITVDTLGGNNIRAVGIYAEIPAITTGKIGSLPFNMTGGSVEINAAAAQGASDVMDDACMAVCLVQSFEIKDGAPTDTAGLQQIQLNGMALNGGSAVVAGPYTVMDISTGETPTYTSYINTIGTVDADGTVTPSTGMTVLPALTGTVTIQGTPQVGSTLTAQVSGLPEGVSVTYQWQAADSAEGPFTDIQGATESSYTPTSDQVGQYLRVVVKPVGEAYGGALTATTTQAVVKPYIPPANPNYKITVDDTQGGTVVVTPTSAKAGTTVTIAATPDEGFAVDTVTVTDRFGEPLDVTENPNGTYTFVMPDGQVTVTATFTETAPEPLPFTDVAEGDWFYDAVRYAYENGLMDGVGGDRFAPNSATTRAQLVTILYRLEGEPAVSGDLPFTDVESGTWYTNAVLWAAQNGIVNGVSNTEFAPGDDLTRQQLVTILYRYAEAKGYDVSASADLSGYPDADQVQDYAQPAMAWAVAEGIVEGMDGNLNPAGNASRAQIATILMRFCEDVAQ